MTHPTTGTETTRIRRRAASASGPATRPASARYCAAGSRGAESGLRSRHNPSGARLSLPGGYAGTVRTKAAQPALQLTRRGRLLLVLMAATLLVVVFSLGRATAAADPTGARVVRPSVVMHSGETLWQVARRIAPRTDPRVTVERILQLNDLRGADQVRPGQQIILPG